MNYYEFNDKATSWEVMDMGVSADMTAMVETIDSMVLELDAARKAHDFPRADEVREMIREIRVGSFLQYGVSLCTGREGTEWNWTIREQ